MTQGNLRARFAADSWFSRFSWATVSDTGLRIKWALGGKFDCSN